MCYWNIEYLPPKLDTARAYNNIIIIFAPKNMVEHNITCDNDDAHMHCSWAHQVMR